MRFDVRSVGSATVALTVCAALLAGCGDDDDAPQDATPATSATTQGSTTPGDVDVGDVAVSVSVRGLEDAVGEQLAGVLFRGPEALAPEALGGFAVTVDADPFSTTQPVRQPDPDEDLAGGVFPYVSNETLLVEDGTYTLLLFVAADLGPYSRWFPADTPGLEGCEITFVTGDTSSIEIDGHRIGPIEGGTLDRCDPAGDLDGR